MTIGVRWISCLLLAGAAVCRGAGAATTYASASQNANAQKSGKPPPGKTIRRTIDPQLVQQLGSRSYVLRESAASKLLARGVAARKALRAGLQSDDLEIRLRCRELLIRVGKMDLQTRLAAFASGEAIADTKDFAAWPDLKIVLADNHRSRQLYARMAKENWPFLQTLQAGPKQALEGTLILLQANESDPFAPSNQRPTGATLACILLGGLSLKRALPPQYANQIFDLFDQSYVKHIIRKDKHAGPLKELLGAWLTQIGRTVAALQADAFRSLQLSLDYQLRHVGLSIARHILKETQRRKELLQFGGVGEPPFGDQLTAAINVAGRFGDASDVPRLTPYLKYRQDIPNTGELGSPKVQIRDVALAALIRVTRQDHKSYGFDSLANYEKQAVDIYPLALANQETRARALTKWKDWLAKNGPAADLPPGGG